MLTSRGFRRSPAQFTSEVASVVMQALYERYDRIGHRKGRASVEELLAIADHAAAHAQSPYSHHTELLYDENGLPR